MTALEIGRGCGAPDERDVIVIASQGDGRRRVRAIAHLPVIDARLLEATNEAISAVTPTIDREHRITQGREIDLAASGEGIACARDRNHRVGWECGAT
jgi:hypothetical protein